MGYELVDGGKGLRCTKCGNTTYHPDDVKNKYCGYCREYVTGDSVVPIGPEWDMTLIGFVLDKSGSMAPHRADAVSGFNFYLSQVKDYGKPAKLTLTLFDTAFKIVHDNVLLAAVPEMTPADYVPDECTALYDAVGHSVAVMEQEMIKHSKARAVMVIFTDGEENSSREFSHQAIKELIAAKEAQSNWTFMYLSSALEGWRNGAGLGISPGNMANFNSSVSSGAICAAAYSTVRYLASNQGMTRAFTAANPGDYTAINAKISNDTTDGK